MQKGKKILLIFTIILVLIIMVSLFYYSMRATIMEFLFENNQEQQEKITAATGDQAQIMVDLANKQLAKQKQETEIRQDEKENKSLFKELSGAKATVKDTTDESTTENTIESGNAILVETTSAPTKQKPNKVQNGFVVVDCETGGVVACPHNEVQTGTSPMFYKNDKSSFVIGRCLDVSIDVKSFCKTE
jgi:type II secretory pathway pseudopilin PulG